jgi:putative sterol carrier protein
MSPDLKSHIRDIRQGGGVAKYPFLSDEWIAEARKVREEYKANGTALDHVIKMNLVITEVPFGDGTADAHMDTSSGEMEIETGHVEGAGLKVTLDYATAKAILVEGNLQAGMQAFMAGKIKVDGDMSKLMALMAAPADPTAIEVAKRIQEITE